MVGSPKIITFLSLNVPRIATEYQNCLKTMLRFCAFVLVKDLLTLGNCSATYLRELTVKDVSLFVSAGLAGFFPLHPMTITMAERRRAQMETAETAAGTEESPEDGQKQSESWELNPGLVFKCWVWEDGTVIGEVDWPIYFHTYWVDCSQQLQRRYIVIPINSEVSLSNLCHHWYLRFCGFMVMSVECHNRYFFVFTILCDLIKVYGNSCNSLVK